MLVRIDIGSSCMVSLEEQAVRGDNPMQVLQRREADGRLGSSREPRHVPPDHASLGICGPAIGAIDNACAQRLGPRIIRGRCSFFRMNASAIKQQPGGERASHLQQRPSSDANPAESSFWTIPSRPSRIWAARILHTTTFGISFSLVYRVSSLTKLVNSKSVNSNGALQYQGSKNQMSMATLPTKSRAGNERNDLPLAKQAADVARVMNLLSNENRLLILCYLMMRKEMKVGDIVDAVKLNQSALSQHLTKLREDGLVEFRRELQTLYYRIADPRVTKLIRVLKKLYCEGIA